MRRTENSCGTVRTGCARLAKRDRTIATAFGDLTVSRRMYRDADGETIFPLDEYLGRKPGQLASPVPALRGPSASKPWASELRRLVHGGAY